MLFCCFVFWALTPAQQYEVNRDSQRAFEDLVGRVSAAADDFRDGLSVDLNAMRPELERLQAAVAKDAESRVRVTGGQALRLDANEELMFGEIPTLPPEDKRGGRWHFPTVRLEVVPRDLFVYSVSFRGDHTIRLRQATLIFEDGARLVHDQWRDLENGNGQAFPKREYLSPLTVYPPNGERRARIVKAIEITGSAQDAEHAARLDFVFEAPVPNEAPYLRALSLLEDMAESWRGVAADAKRLNRCVDDLAKLAEALGFSFSADELRLE